MPTDSVYVYRPLNHLAKRAESHSFNVVVAFEDFMDGQRAVVALAEEAQKRGFGSMLRASYWKFDLFRDPGLRADALSAAMQADLFIVATGDLLRWPRPTIRGIEECVAARHNKGLETMILPGSDVGGSGEESSGFGDGSCRDAERAGELIEVG